MRMGFDLAQVSAMPDSLNQFGERFASRLFTPAERAYARSGMGVEAERLAARFAAKEAVIKALDLSEAGIGWRDIEVVRQPGGACTIALHGKAARHASEMGVAKLLVSLSHDGDCAGAMVIALLAEPRSPL